MTHPITPVHMKTPALFAQAVNTAYGRVVLDKWSELDPTLAEKQINAAAGVAVFRKSGPLDRGITDTHWSPDGIALAMGLFVS
jgi:hypothetical protein